ncbi:MAG: hypothetical protein QMC67_15035 [Candidatus Wallbacteria bacterium]
MGIDNEIKHYFFQAQDSFKIEKNGFEFYDLRSLMVLLDQSQFIFVCKSSQILHWDKTTKFCGECGSETKHSPSERAQLIFQQEKILEEKAKEINEQLEVIRVKKVYYENLIIEKGVDMWNPFIEKDSD